MWNSSKSQKNHATGIASDSPQGSSSNGVVPLKNIIEKQGKDGENPINDGFRFVIGVPHNHPFLDGIFPEINHPAIGVPPFMDSPVFRRWNLKWSFNLSFSRAVQTSLHSRSRWRWKPRPGPTECTRKVSVDMVRGLSSKPPWLMWSF